MKCSALHHGSSRVLIFSSDNPFAGSVFRPGRHLLTIRQTLAAPVKIDSGCV
jgi:hypothetical protein